MQLYRLILFALLITVSLMAESIQSLASDIRVETSADCDKAVANLELVSCAHADLKIADEKLNLVYKRIIATLDKQGIDVIKKAQREWVKYRDAECKRVADIFRGGRDSSLVEVSCLQKLTDDRIYSLITGLSHENTIASKSLTSSSLDDLKFPTQVVWLDSNLLFEKFDCKGYSFAKLALARNIENGDLKVIVVIGQHKVMIPVGNDNGVSGIDLSLSVSQKANGCPSLRLDDGMTDSHLISWNIKKKKFFVERSN